MARHPQITQNNKFAIPLQYLKKEMSDEVNFLHADKDKSMIQIDTVIFIGMVKHSKNFQHSTYAMSLQYLRKEDRDEVDCLHADKHQSFQQVVFNTLGISFLQDDAVISDRHNQRFLKYSK